MIVCDRLRKGISHMNFDVLSFGLGMLFTLVVGGLIAITIARKRHSCYFCGRHTTRVCRMIILPLSADTPIGQRKVISYIFRVCMDHGKICHVTHYTKMIYMPFERAQKKVRRESDWGSPFMTDVCRVAGIANPSHTPIASLVLI